MIRSHFAPREPQPPRPGGTYPVASRPFHRSKSLKDDDDGAAPAPPNIAALLMDGATAEFYAYRHGFGPEQEETEG